jgi:hypothetical protein
MKRAFSGLIYLVFGLPLALSALLLLSVRPWALDREFYKRIVGDDRLYAAIQAPGPGARVEEVVTIGGKRFDLSALVGAARKNLPVAELKATGTKTVDVLLDLVEGKNASGRIELDLRPLKGAIRSRAAAIAGDYAAALPVRPELPAPEDFSWRPERLSVGQAGAQAAGALRQVVDSGMPDLVSEPARVPVFRTGRDATGGRGLQSVGITQALLDRGAALLSVLSAALLGGLAWLGGSTAGRRLVRAGRMLLLPSIVVLGIGFALAIPGGMLLDGLIPPEARAALSGLAGSSLRGYLASVFGTMAMGFRIAGLVGSSLGGLLVSARRIAEPKEIE